MYQLDYSQPRTVQIQENKVLEVPSERVMARESAMVSREARRKMEALLRGAYSAAETFCVDLRAMMFR